MTLTIDSQSATIGKVSTGDASKALRYLAGGAAMLCIVALTAQALALLVAVNVALLLLSVVLSAVRVATVGGPCGATVSGFGNIVQFSAKQLTGVWSWTLAS